MRNLNAADQLASNLFQFPPTLTRIIIIIIIIMAEVPICSIIPDVLLQNIADNQQISSHSRACAVRSLVNNHRLRSSRANVAERTRSVNVVPDYLYEAIIDNDAVPEGVSEQRSTHQGGLTIISEARAHARRSKIETERLRATNARGVVLLAASASPTRRMRRVLYDCEHTDEVPGVRVLREGQDIIHVDSCARVSGETLVTDVIADQKRQRMCRRHFSRHMTSITASSAGYGHATHAKPIRGHETLN
jgi:hypothetical protein